MRQSKSHCKRVHDGIKRSRMGCKNNAVEKKTKIRSGHPPIFNKLILFNSRIKSIYKNKINKKQ